MGRRKGGKIDLRRGDASAGYLRGQQKGVERFERFLDRRGVVWRSWTGDNAEEIDTELSNWIQHEFESKQALFATTCGILAIQRRYKLQYRLPDCWSAIRMWRRVRPFRRRRPLSPFLWKCVLLALLARAGLPGANAHSWIGTAVLVMVGFAGLGRPGELNGLLTCHVGLPGDERIGGGNMAVLLIISPKNRAHMGATQFIAIESKAVIRWLEWWIRDRPNHHFVFPRYAEASRCFKEVCAELGLEELGYTLGSLRTGGATAHFRQFRNLAALQYLGRWANPNTLAFYLQETMSEHLTTQIPEIARDRLANLARYFHLLRGPPASRAPRRP